MAVSIGADVGGTFTDVVLYDADARSVVIAKGPSSSDCPDDGVVGILETQFAEGTLISVDYFVHGTTVGLNSILQRSGASVGVVTTEGFRDVLEVRRGVRASLYDLMWTAPPPLVPRSRRMTVRERVDAKGTVVIELDRATVRAACRRLLNVDCVAVVLIHSYANPAHERAVAEILLADGYRGQISLSSDISSEHREYERTVTTVVDAYIKPHVGQYLGRLAQKLSDRGFRGQAFVTRSGGGALTFEEAANRPCETLLSGPAAGAVAAARLCERLDIPLAIGADVGGTSFDACLLVDGRPEMKYQGVLDGMPIQTPWVDVRSIGAGGGSVASVDDGGFMCVGPRSAGAVPGPACYGRGGQEATLTDAAMYLGMLADGQFAAGVALEGEAAEVALEVPARLIGKSAREAARGIVVIAAAAMADLMRGIFLEHGQDPRAATLVAFGGAGPLLACLMVDELGIRRAVVPRGPGVLSAMGLVQQEVVRSAGQTFVAPLGEDALLEVGRISARLHASLDERRTDKVDESPERATALDLRYLGQEHTISIPIGANGRGTHDADSVLQAFHSEHQRVFGHRLKGLAEIVTVRAESRIPLTSANGELLEWSVSMPKSTIKRPATWDSYSFRRACSERFRVLDRSELSSGMVVMGPAIICEATSTTYIDHGFRATCHPEGSLILEVLA